MTNIECNVRFFRSQTKKILLYCVNELLRRRNGVTCFFTAFSCTNVQVIWKTFVCLKIAKKKAFKTGAEVT